MNRSTRKYLTVNAGLWYIFFLNFGNVFLFSSLLFFTKCWLTNLRQIKPKIIKYVYKNEFFYIRFFFYNFFFKSRSGFILNPKFSRNPRIPHLLHHLPHFLFKYLKRLIANWNINILFSCHWWRKLLHF